MSLTKSCFKAVLMAVLALTLLVPSIAHASHYINVGQNAYNGYNVCDINDVYGDNVPWCTWSSQYDTVYPTSTTDPLPSSVSIVQGLQYYLGVKTNPATDGLAWAFDLNSSDSGSRTIQLQVNAVGPWIALWWDIDTSTPNYITVSVIASVNGVQVAAQSFSSAPTASTHTNLTIGSVPVGGTITLTFDITYSNAVTATLYVQTFEMFDKITINNNLDYSVVVYNGSQYVTIAPGSSHAAVVNPNVRLYSWLEVKAKDSGGADTNAFAGELSVFNIEVPLSSLTHVNKSLANVTVPSTGLVIYPENMSNYWLALQALDHGRLWCGVNSTWFNRFDDDAVCTVWLIDTSAKKLVNVATHVWYEVVDASGNKVFSAPSPPGTVKVPDVGVAAYIYDYGSGAFLSYVGLGGSVVSISVPAPANSSSLNATIESPLGGSWRIGAWVTVALQASPLVPLGVATLALLVTGRHYAGIGCAVAAGIMAVALAVGAIPAEYAPYVGLLSVGVVFGFLEAGKKR